MKAKKRKKIGAMTEFVLQSLFKKPATVKYPFEKMPMPPKFRGELKFYPEKCSGCLLCMKDCPTRAITIKKVGEKKFEAEIDLGKCIYCAQCVDSCPRKALEATPKFELAQIERDKLKVTFHAEPGPGNSAQANS
jgi:formate hydrogenlyase subunit 6/NADH:ubiquinone oxidoreductase subunit I